MTAVQSFLLTSCGVCVASGLLMLIVKGQVMTAIFFALIALVFAIIYFGARVK